MGIAKYISDGPRKGSKIADSQECSAGTTPVKFEVKYEEARTPTVQVGIPQASAEFDLVSPTTRHDGITQKTEGELYELRAQEIQIVTNQSYRKADESALAKQGLQNMDSQEDNANILNEI